MLPERPRLSLSHLSEFWEVPDFLRPVPNDLTFANQELIKQKMKEAMRPCFWSQPNSDM